MKSTKSPKAAVATQTAPVLTLAEKFERMTDSLLCRLNDDIETAAERRRRIWDITDGSVSYRLGWHGTDLVKSEFCAGFAEGVKHTAMAKGLQLSVSLAEHVAELSRGILRNRFIESSTSQMHNVVAMAKHTAACDLVERYSRDVESFVKLCATR